jgi:hypothetical protein
MVAPVPVAIAKLDLNIKTNSNSVTTSGGYGSAGDFGKDQADVSDMSSNGVVTFSAATQKPKKKWDELSLVQRAGILCEEGGFRKFWEEEYPVYLNLCNGDVAKAVRQYCQIESRAELDSNDQAGKIFTDLEAEYRAWRLVAE